LSVSHPFFIRSFAKLNLFLYVVSKRHDGYHELCSLMTCIDLCDELYPDFNAKKIAVSCDHPEVPSNESNLAFKAACLFYDSLKKPVPGKKAVSIHISKKIPPGGGLGGGSSNAASVLMALNKYYQYPFTQEEIMRLGLCLGADVPFFIFGGPAIAKGIGEQLTKFPELYPYYTLLCDPGVSASTAQVYKNLNFNLTPQEKYTIYAGFDKLIRGQEQGRKTDISAVLHNDLEEPACRLYPEINKTKKEMELLLHKKVHMTGSGSSLFVLYSDRKSAEQGYECLLNKWDGSKKQIFLSSFRQ
jgi:4-diphosphocytidyl-2-C-methyl-D-erythritol kinase